MAFLVSGQLQHINPDSMSLFAGMGVLAFLSLVSWVWAMPDNPISSRGSWR